MTLRVLSLFAGIGGFDLGLERTGGFKTVAFCERDPFCTRVLNKHWPDVPVFPDVRSLRGPDVGAVDVICGGYPCQPFSHAGERRGAEDDRHLWPEMRRLVDELRPAWVIGENVAGHVSMGLDDVLSDLEARGYAARPFVIPAIAVDARHRRDRVWIVANADGQPRRWQPRIAGSERAGAWPEPSGCGEDVADAIGERQPRPRALGDASHPAAHRQGKAADALDGGVGSVWRAEPDVGRVAHGVPNRLDRLRALGNAVVPQIPELIGRAILASLAEQKEAA